jgi:hypothetical protein
MPKFVLPSAALLVSLVLVACSSAASPTAAPPGGPGSSPPPSQEPTIGGEAVDHPTGAADVILRMEQGGGFVPIEVAAGGAPIFTLYGDGRVVFQQFQDVFPEAGPDGITRYPAWRTAQLDAGQVEELLTFALGPGGLGTARDIYADVAVIDAGNTIFKIDAGGLDKTVTITALGMEPTGGPDDADRASFQKLAERLQDFDQGGTISTDVYVPTAYRGVLVEREVDPAVPGPSASPWPWPELTLDDFPVGDGVSAPTFPHKSLTGDEIAALIVGDVLGGAQGMIVEGPDGKTYAVVLRPLLPDETTA